jgi:ABC-type transport system substrate-binding protein
MTEAIAEMWEDVGVNVVVEVIDSATRHVKNRQQSFKGLWWSDPTSILRDPDGMMGRLLSPGQPHDYWRHPEFERLRLAARAGEEADRAAAYRKMTAIFLEHNPWIVVVQPYEDYGLRRYVDSRRTPTSSSSSGASTSGCAAPEARRPRRAPAHPPGLRGYPAKR